MSGHNDPRLLYSIPNIRAYHIQDGDESELTPSGPQTLSLLMVPTDSPFADLPDADPHNDEPEEDFYLHLHLPPELDLPLPATTQIYHKPPSSYLIPRWDLGPDSGAFTRVEFPAVGKGSSDVSQEDIDTFETILAQCTAFLERASPPSVGGGGYPREKARKQSYSKYNPADYAPGEGYAYGGGSSTTGGVGSSSKARLGQHGHIVLIDEENGSVVGELSDGFNVVEDPHLEIGSKNPVEIKLPTEPNDNRISICPTTPEYLQDAMHPAYASSSIVRNAAVASRLIVTTSAKISNAITGQAESFTQKTKPNPKPMTFTESTHGRVRKLHSATQGAANLSSKTVGSVSKVAQNLGATVARREKKNRDGKGEDYKPGLLNKSLMAFSTIADGIDTASKTLLTSVPAAATTVVGHRYGDEARELARSVTGGMKNVALVYVDATGVSRKAVVKSVAKGMVVGKVKNARGDEQQLVVGGNDGGIVTGTPGEWERDYKNPEGPGANGGGHPSGRLSPEGYGNGNGGSTVGAPPAYSSEAGEPYAHGGVQGHGTGYEGYYGTGSDMRKG